MKALGIVGSPRRNGNVDTLVSKVLEGAQEAGLETSKYILNEMNYSGCQACEYCKSHDHCRLDDDLTELFAEMKEADAVVFGSPIYFFLFSGQFKLMEDRMYSLIDAAFVPASARERGPLSLPARGMQMLPAMPRPQTISPSP